MKENENDREEDIISPISTSGKKQETNFPTFLWSWVTREGQLFAQYLLFLSFFSSCFQDSQKDPQNVSQTSTSSGLRKTKSAILLSGANSKNTRTSALIKKGQENTVSINAKVAKLETSILKPPVVLVNTLDTTSNKKQRGSDVTFPLQVESTAESLITSNVPRKLPLSSNDVENEAKSKVEFKRKPMVRFQTATDDIDLSETQSTHDNAPDYGGLLKENSQPEVN